MTTTHDITLPDGRTFIMEWRHDTGEENEPTGYIMLSETCDDYEHDEEVHMHETYDFKEVN